MKSNLRASLSFALLVLLALGCGSKEKSSTKEVPKPAVPVTEAKVLKPQVDATPAKAPVEIVALSVKTVGEKESLEAQALHAAARKHHQAKNYDEAITTYAKALAVDPSHLYARYNLACALSSSGQHDSALEQLSQFSEHDSNFFRSRLIRARTDEEWKTLWPDARFIELTKDLEIKPANIRASANAFSRALRSGDTSPIATLIHPHKKVKLIDRVSGHDDTRTIRDEFDTAEALQAWIRESGYAPKYRREMREYGEMDVNGYGSGHVTSCTAECCKFDDDCDGDLRCGAGHDGAVTRLAKVCFSLDSGTAPYISKVHFQSTEE